jgi:hypothetical protein
MSKLVGGPGDALRETQHPRRGACPPEGPVFGTITDRACAHELKGDGEHGEKAASTKERFYK